MTASASRCRRPPCCWGGQRPEPGPPSSLTRSCSQTRPLKEQLPQRAPAGSPESRTLGGPSPAETTKGLRAGKRGLPGESPSPAGPSPVVPRGRVLFSRRPWPWRVGGGTCVPSHVVLCLFQHSGINSSNAEVLALFNVTEADAGEYICKVSNYIGQANQSAWLTVLPKQQGNDVSGSSSLLCVVFLRRRR